MKSSSLRLCRRYALLALLIPAFANPAAGNGVGSPEDEDETAAAAPDARAIEFFERKIRPVLVERCYECHAADADEIHGGLVMDTRAGMHAGGDSGPAVVPGEPEASLLLEAIRYESFEMPPDGRLPDEVIQDFQQWIAMGAADPRDGNRAPVRAEIDFEAGRRHWAFQPVGSPAIPPVRRSDWPRDPIDFFILAELERREMDPVGDASRRVLMRRLYFDLIGLPPTPAQQEAFLNDDAPGAVERLVDQLLESPHFGEKWGRHWLDVARFAESNGRERNFLYPHAWRYRDYVIEAFNADAPFDRFLREQIAGDLVDYESEEDRRRLLIATGFLALGPKSLNETNRDKFVMDMVDEQVDIVTRSTMALTVSCARCHDHKFDPIPTAEYYSLAGIFRSSRTLYGTKGQGNRHPAQLEELEPNPEWTAFVERTAELDQRRTALRRQVANVQTRVNRQRPEEGVEPDEEYRELVQRLDDLRSELRQVEASLSGRDEDAPDPPLYAMAVREGSAADCRIHVRGDADRLGDEVPRGWLTILSQEDRPFVESEGSGRVELAEWITDPQNPLTARVAVNRIWHHLIGRGLVRTVDNFGATGERPTHPELLDHLADRFVRNGWSTKGLIRAIVLSRTYQLDGTRHPGNDERDPDNVALWRSHYRRLDAEAMRDAMLLASGRLQRTPPAGSPVADLGDGVVGRDVQVGQLQESPHRSVYQPILRNAVPESLRLFDFAEPSMLVGTRQHTTVPSQALFLMNGPLVVEESARFAARLATEVPEGAEERVRQGYRIALAREPSDGEILRSREFISHVSERLLEAGDDDAGKAERLAWSAWCQAILASAEFRYIE